MRYLAVLFAPFPPTSFINLVSLFKVTKTVCDCNVFKRLLFVFCILFCYFKNTQWYESPFSLRVIIAFAISVILTGFSAYKQSSSTADFYNEL